MSPKRHRSRQNRSLQTGTTTTTQLVAASYSGPLPPPAALERYEQICPGASDRILKQWEAQTQHRQSIETAVVASNVAATARGQWLGAFLAIIVMAIGGTLIAGGKGAAGVTLLVAEVASLAAIFVLGKRRANRELDDKRH